MSIGKLNMQKSTLAFKLIRPAKIRAFFKEGIKKKREKISIFDTK
jgi:hypothetical protein